MHLTQYVLLGSAALVLYQVVVRIVTYFQYESAKRANGCQEPPKLPGGGFLGLKQLKSAGAADKAMRLLEWLQARQATLSRQEGRLVTTCSYSILGQKCYFTSDPKNIQAMLATQFADFDLGATRNAIMGEVLGKGVFTTDGKAWEHSRAMLRPNFIREQVSDLDMEERHVNNLITVLRAAGPDGWTDYTDIQSLFFRLTIDAATEFLFGESVNSQVSEAAPGVFPAASSKTGSDGHDERAFSQNFDSAQRHMANKFRLQDMHWLYRSADYTSNGKVVNDFVQHYVDLALAQGQQQSPTKNGKEKYVFLEALAQQTRDPVVLRAQLLNILLAGRDTTASLLSWTLHELLRHPAEFAQLRTAILSHFGPYSAPDRASRITFSSLKNCTQLQWTINEALRLWTVVPGNVRRTNKPTTLPRGGGPDGLAPIYLPAQTSVDYSTHIMHRRPDLWGEDADQFRPARWEGRRYGWEYLPFNGGPRICIGQQFALTEASYVLVRLLQRFDQIELPADAPVGPPRQKLTLTCAPGDPVTLRLHVASE